MISECVVEENTVFNCKTGYKPITPNERNKINRNERNKINRNERNKINRNVKNKKRKQIHAGFKRFQAPVFNIHIHIPQNKGKTSTTYVPPVQPVIHIHFDEIVRKLEINENLSKEAVSETFKHLFEVTSPKFGNVKFHFDNKSKKTNINDITPSSSQNQRYDTRKNRSETSGKIQNDVSGSTEPDSSIIDESKNVDTGTTSSYFYKDKKLKNAVVVLKDICKEKNFSVLKAGGRGLHSVLLPNGVNDSSCDVLKMSNQQKNTTLLDQDSCLDSPHTSKPVTLFKIENEFDMADNSTHKPVTLFRIENEFDVAHNSTHKPVTLFRIENEFDVAHNSTHDSSSSKALINIKPDPTAEFQENNSLTDLAEGCNFSEILNRFKIKKIIS